MLAATKARLLLIDDSMPDLRVLTEIATAHGWSVSVAFNGKDGYHKAQLSKFDLILLDVKMPVLDGFETCRLLKANLKTRPIPVVFLSAAGEQTDRLQGLLLGAVDYIVKSYANEEEIAARVAISLQRSNFASGEETTDLSLNDSLPSAPLVRAAKKIFLQELARPPAAQELARELGSSEKRLNEAFREQYGMTAYGWLRDERLRMARELLLSTDLPIFEIAQSLGYSNAQNFATAFKEYFECSPSQFRDGLTVRS
jgi:DNA-binding response OmpR family regulator